MGKRLLGCNGVRKSKCINVLKGDTAFRVMLTKYKDEGTGVWSILPDFLAAALEGDAFMAFEAGGRRRTLLVLTLLYSCQYFEQRSSIWWCCLSRSLKLHNQLPAQSADVCQEEGRDTDIDCSKADLLHLVIVSKRVSNV